LAGNKQSDITGSRIILGGTGTVKIFHQLGMDMVQTSRICTRSTEVAAELLGKEGTLTELHRELMYLERVGLQPDLYPEVADRPMRRISGYHLHLWIGKRVGLGVKDVAVMLDQVEAIMNQNARAHSW